MRPPMTASVLGTGLLLIACSSESTKATADPAECNGKGVYAAAEACDKFKAAFGGKCAGETFDCEKYFSQITGCSNAKRKCREGIDKGVADLSAAVDCSAAKAVAAPLVCFD